MMPQPSPTKLNRIVNITDILYSVEEIKNHTEKIRIAYEHLKVRYDLLSKELELRNGGRAPIHSSALNHGHKRRKTDEYEKNDSQLSNDPLNEAIQDISSCVEDEVIESTPKPDISKKNIPKKMVTLNLPNSFIDRTNKIKIEKLDDSNDGALHVDTKTELKKSPESPLRSVENQINVGKENRSKTKWMSSNALISPRRIDRAGFISTKSPKTRLSLSKTFKQSAIEFPKKQPKDTVVDTCVETFLDIPPKKTGDVKGKFLRQQCLEACMTPSKDSDDDTVFNFKSNMKLNKNDSTSPPNIKLEPLTGQAKISTVSPSNRVTHENNLLEGASGSSSVIALSGIKNEVIEIAESQPLFDDCSETFCEKVELKVLPMESVPKKSEMNNDQRIVDEHIAWCRQCKIFMESNVRLTMEEKVGMVERCKCPTRQDTDSEFWNPRFNPTPASQKQETLIDDRWGMRDKKF